MKSEEMESFFLGIDYNHFPPFAGIVEAVRLSGAHMCSEISLSKYSAKIFTPHGVQARRKGPWEFYERD